jgi:AcrR family transcriptional regulator
MSIAKENRMPTPARTSIDRIVAAGRAILETEGITGVTMNAVAAQVGVRPPSLYKHVSDRDALLGLVADAAVGELGAKLAHETTAAELARTVRAWALAHPAAFQLAFSGRAAQDALAASSEPVLRVSRELAGSDNALMAARLLTAWCNGFVTMELAGAFQLGGDVDASFEFALERLTAALSRH